MTPKLAWFLFSHRIGLPIHFLKFWNLFDEAREKWTQSFVSENLMRRFLQAAALTLGRPRSIRFSHPKLWAHFSPALSNRFPNFKKWIGSPILCENKNQVSFGVICPGNSWQLCYKPSFWHFLDLANFFLLAVISAVIKIYEIFFYQTKENWLEIMGAKNISKSPTVKAKNDGVKTRQKYFVRKFSTFFVYKVWKPQFFFKIFTCPDSLFF